MDVWVPGGTTFQVKLVDFGADGVFGGTGADQDTQHELTFTAATTPALQHREWTGSSCQLSAFTGLVDRGHLAQLILSGDVGTAYVDNIYFHK
jgi:hypothetical protein